MRLAVLSKSSLHREFLVARERARSYSVGTAWTSHWHLLRIHMQGETFADILASDAEYVWWATNKVSDPPPALRDLINYAAAKSARERARAPTIANATV